MSMLALARLNATVIATNHLEPFLMTNLLLETPEVSAPARIINLASKGPSFFPCLKIEFDNLNEKAVWKRLWDESARLVQLD